MCVIETECDILSQGMGSGHEVWSLETEWGVLRQGKES